VLDDPPELAEQRGIPVAERTGPYHLLPLEQRRQQGDHERVDVEQRQRGEHRRVGVEQRVGGDHPCVGDLVGVCMRGQLRRPGRAAGVEEAGEIGRAWRVCGEAGRPHAGSEIGEVTDAHPVHGGQRRGRLGSLGRPQHQERVEDPLAGEIQRALPGRRRELRPGGEEHLGAGAPQQLGEVSTVQAAVERCRDPGQLRGQRRGDQFGAVGGEERDRVAAADAEPASGPRRGAR
jgi:hypothetical protein